jgi:methanethiol oxidase
MAEIDTDPTAGGLSIDERFLPHGEDFRDGGRTRYARREVASSDSCCYR